MGDRRPQTYQNHTRFDPLFHFFLVPLSAILFLAAIWHAFQQPEFISLWLALSSLLFVVAVIRIRTYSLKVQDRVIRLEERLRLAALLPESLRLRTGDLTESQLIALRFASDTELASLAARTIEEHLTPSDIKKSIHGWRPDYFRV